MNEASELLTALCEMRRISYVAIAHDWRIEAVGGSKALLPGLVRGADLRHVLPEIVGREGDIRSALDRSAPFVLRWIERPGPRRTRFYELLVHQPASGPNPICWVIDRSAYGRLKSRIDRYYAELFESGAEADTDRPATPIGAVEPD